MYRVNIYFGVQNITRNYSTPPTARQIKQDANVKSALGFSDNVKLLIAGVEMPDEAIIPNDASVTIETRANQKAE